MADAREMASNGGAMVPPAGPLPPETLRDALRASERDAALELTRRTLARHGTRTVLHALMESSRHA